MIISYLKSAWRNIKKHKGFSLINAGGLAIGIASCVLLLMYVAYHFSFDKQFKNIDQIYVVMNNQPGDEKIMTFSATPRQLAAAAKAEIPGVEEAVRTISYTANGLLTYNNNSLKKNGLYADAPFFNIFSYKFFKGDPQKALTEPNSIVITKDLSEVMFGSEDPIGKTIVRDNKKPLMVTAVIETPQKNSTFQFDYIMPWALFEENNEWARTTDWGSNFARTYIKMKKGVDIASANNILKPIVGKNNEGNENELFLFPFTKTHLYEKFENGRSVGGMIDQLRLFLVLAFVILLIACVNFMNLSTARSEKRAREVGIRKAIGSTRRSLIWQFITESLLLSFIATFIAMILVVLCLPYFNQLLKLELHFPASDPLAWLMLLSIAMLTGFLSGSYPAFYLSSFKPVKVLKGVFQNGKNALSIRKVLVVVQFAFAVCLITSTICIYRQIMFIQSNPTGYNNNNLVELPVEGVLGQKSELLINELKSSGAIINGTGLSAGMTQDGNNTWAIDWAGKPENMRVLFDIFGVGFDFVKTSGVQLIAGREFSPEFPADTAGKTVLLNESAAKLMKVKQPVGSIVKWGGSDMTVVGVYKDFVLGSPYQKTRPMITPFVQGDGANTLALRLNPAKSVSSALEQINNTLKSVNPGFPPAVHFTDSDFERKFQNEQLLATLANLFGGLAIIISCLGLFGLAAYAAEQRVKEIGVRKVLGASVFNLALLLSKDFIRLVVISIVVAIPLSAWALNKWLDNYELRISLSWGIFAFAALITFAIAIATMSYQAIKSAMTNPVKNLRSE